MLGGFEEDLGRAENVAGGVKRGGDTEFERVRHAEGELGSEAFAGDAGVEKTGSGGRAEDFGVAGDVIGMGVRNEGARDAGLGVEGPADFREVDAFAVMDFPGHAVTGGWAAAAGRRDASRRLN